ncbi:hypothetical protein CKO25_10500 [Thiocapsa imhoffii]|uniref:Glycosyltransferase 2-like domain-containing protein n=1 Tax=Thiocapsa imhoffii TaxID=382777 RepID=A0A9X0WHZ4_9GAMM|nr:glycosyltransferase [Thiocapsa imhoffii]MBK1645074.1 hypothetical protein [Thiocapsa imhoffii]
MLSVLIPTYRREAVLLESLRQLQALSPAPSEIVVVDQTDRHTEYAQQQLQRLHAQGRIRWIRLMQPSIPGAMNTGLLAARSEIVLFLDDDIRPGDDLVGAHLRAQAVHPGLIAGQVLQPGECSSPLAPNERFRFNSTASAWVNEFMGGNFSVSRDMALALGGFDENFVGAAYRFEAEFAHRFTARYGAIRYEPAALIHHLQVSSGGTRAHGHHLRTIKPGHSVGAYYFWLRVRPPGWWWRLLARPLRAVRTRHHLQQPWWIPLTLLAELRGMRQALGLVRQGPRLLAGDTPPANAESSADLTG